MISRIWKHLSSWAEGYFWVPVMGLSIWLSGVVVRALNGGHALKENIDWLVDYQATSYKCILIVLFTSIFKQATGTWLTKEEKLEHPYLATVGAVTVLLSFFAFIYLFMH